MQTEYRSQKIAVTGATGRVGSPLVEILEQRGHDVVPIARSKGVDVVSGEGLDEAPGVGELQVGYRNRRSSGALTPSDRRAPLLPRERRRLG
jgi:glutamate dehydrogenase/leucine dehydrogenase